MKFLAFDDEAVQFTYAGYVQTNAPSAALLDLSIDGAAPAGALGGTQPFTAYAISSVCGSMEKSCAEGLHYVTLLGSVFNGSQVKHVVTLHASLSA